MCTQISITNANHNHKFKFYSGGEFQWSFTQITVRILCVYAKTFKSSFGRRGLRDLGTFAHMCLYTNSFLSRICILKTNYNHHCNDHSNYEFSLVCKVHHSKEELQSSLQWWFKLQIFSRVYSNFMHACLTKVVLDILKACPIFAWHSNK